MSVCAVVVTRDRRALLERCLAAVRPQADRTLVVDNASTDGTGEWLARQAGDGGDLAVLALPENRGGAGGFHAGMARAHAGGAEWLWLLDDDTIPDPGALAALLAAPSADAKASVARWTDGRLHPMNVPGIERDDVAAVLDAAPDRVLPLRAATFVSLLVHRRAIDRFGLPRADFFLWSDDVEYTARIARGGGRVLLVPASTVEHATARPHTAVSEAGPRFFFHVRNTLWMLRGDAWDRREKLSLVYLLALTTAGYLQAGGAPATVWRGLRAGTRPTGAPRG